MLFNFPVENNLAHRVQLGDLEALFQVGPRALLAQRFEEAEAIFQETQQKKHPLAKIYLNITAARSKSLFILNGYVTITTKNTFHEGIRNSHR